MTLENCPLSIEDIQLELDEIREIARKNTSKALLEIEKSVKGEVRSLKFRPDQDTRMLKRA